MASAANESPDAEQRRLAAVPGAPALGRGPAAEGDYSRHEYHHHGCAAGSMPELNVLCGIADLSTQSEQPVTKHLVVQVTPSRERAPVD